jgi:hypothetical protein
MSAVEYCSTYSTYFLRRDQLTPDAPAEILLRVGLHVSRFCPTRGSILVKVFKNIFGLYLGPVHFQITNVSVNAEGGWNHFTVSPTSGDGLNEWMDFIHERDRTKILVQLNCGATPSSSAVQLTVNQNFGSVPGRS